MLRRGKLRLLRAKGADSGVVFFSRKIAVERVSENNPFLVISTEKG